MSDFDYSKLDIVKYARKPFVIDAVQVTEDNIEDVAKWASADVRTDNDKAARRYIKVRVLRPLKERQTKAYVGDWVLYAGTGYKVYTATAFTSNFEIFEEPQDGTSPVAEKKVVKKSA